MSGGPLPERIFLVGFMGAGKTTIAKGLADRLGYDFVDTDQMVESAEGRTVEALFRERGEGYFRGREWEALASLAHRSRIVVATGGGLFLATLHRAFIRRHGTSVWLDVPLEVIWERGREETARPLFTTYEELRDLLESRRERYALADHRIDVGNRDVDSVMREILSRLAASEDSREDRG